MDYILNVEDLSKNYDNFSLKNINFQIPKGSITGLIGENGAGKTTTIKLILNLIRKNHGNIQIFGLDHITDEMKIKENIGVVLDESNFHNNLKPTDISVIMNNIYNNWDKPLFLYYLDKFKLPKNKIVKEFSKGMKMKLSIAVALSHDPQLLILDEPTGGLDPVSRNEILDIFLEFIQNEEKSILFSTHITSDLDKIADYITFIHEGSIILSESKDQLIDSYGILKCGINDFSKIEKTDVIGYRKSQFNYEALVKNKQQLMIKYKDFTIDPANLEDIMLFYFRRDS